MAYTKEQREAKEKLEMEKLNTVTSNEDVSETKTDELSKDDIAIKVETKKTNIKNIPISTTVLVRSNCYGQLTYKSKKTGFQIDWDNVQSQQYLSLDELLTMRNTFRKFFEKTWIIIDGFVDDEYSNMFSVEEILDFLQVKQYYKNLLCPENINELFNMTPDEITKRIATASSGSKDFIIIKANELIESGNLDSLKTINTLEKVLNCELSRPE